MTDQQIWNLVLYVGGWLLSLLGAVWGIAWWLKSQITSGEIGGLKERCEVLEERRLLAEQQNTITAEKLAAVEAQLVTAQNQVKAHAPADVISGTIYKIQSSTSAAISSSNTIGRMLRADPPPGGDVASFDGLTGKSNK